MMADDADAPDQPKAGASESSASVRDVVWDRWAEVDGLLERVLDVPEAERNGFLADTCPDDPELVAAVLSLARDGSDTVDAALGPGPEVLRAALAEEAGVELGP